MGEVQTSEEATVYVHDLELFVTVQILDDTLAVLSLGKLCKEHVYTYEWASGQKPHLTEQGKKIPMQNGKFRTSCLLSLDCRQILVPVRPQHRYRCTRHVHLQVQQQSESTRREDRLRDPPEWSKEFTENLEDTEVPAPAHISHDSDSERPSEEAPRKHNIFTHFPEDRNCEVCLRTKMQGLFAGRRTGEAVPRAEKFG